MPLGSSSAAPVITPGPTRLNRVSSLHRVPSWDWATVIAGFETAPGLYRFVSGADACPALGLGSSQEGRRGVDPSSATMAPCHEGPGSPEAPSTGRSNPWCRPYAAGVGDGHGRTSRVRHGNG